MQDAFSDFKSWYFSKPLVTRSYLSGVCLLAALVSLAIVSPYGLTYTFKETIFSFQIWRPFTAAVFMGKFSFGILFQMYFAYIFLSKTETEIFSKENYADFLWLVIWLLLSLVIISSIYPLYIYSVAFLMAITYIYCKRRPHEEFSLMFGFKVKSGYFPFVWVAVKVLLFQDSLMPNLIGIALGHLYIFLKDIYAVQNHKDFLATPQFFKKWWYRDSYQRVPNPADGPIGNQRRNVFAGQGVRIG